MKRANNDRPQDKRSTIDLINPSSRTVVSTSNMKRLRSRWYYSPVEVYKILFKYIITETFNSQNASTLLKISAVSKHYNIEYNRRIEEILKNFTTKSLQALFQNMLNNKDSSWTVLAIFYCFILRNTHHVITGPNTYKIVYPSLICAELVEEFEKRIRTLGSDFTSQIRKTDSGFEVEFDTFFYPPQKKVIKFNNSIPSINALNVFILIYCNNSNILKLDFNEQIELLNFLIKYNSKEYLISLFSNFINHFCNSTYYQNSLNLTNFIIYLLVRDLITQANIPSICGYIFRVLENPTIPLPQHYRIIHLLQKLLKMNLFQLTTQGANFLKIYFNRQFKELLGILYSREKLEAGASIIQLLIAAGHLHKSDIMPFQIQILENHVFERFKYRCTNLNFVQDDLEFLSFFPILKNCFL